MGSNVNVTSNDRFFAEKAGESLFKFYRKDVTPKKKKKKEKVHNVMGKLEFYLEINYYKVSKT